MTNVQSLSFLASLENLDDHKEKLLTSIFEPDNNQQKQAKETGVYK